MPVGSCSCGGAADRGTCDLCKAGLCRDCDVLSRPLSDLEAWPVPVTGFGYLNRVWDYRYPYLGLKPGDGAVYGPFLYLNELLSSLDLAHGLRHRNGAGPVRHLCWRCLHTAVPDTAERIAGGLMCETPRCVNEPCERCSCCAGAFCEECLAQVRPGAPAACRITWTEPGTPAGPDGEVVYIPGSTMTRSIIPWMPRGLCVVCTSERQRLQKELSEQIVAARFGTVLAPAPQGPGEGAENTAEFELPAIRRWTPRGRRRERARAEAVLGRCVAELAPRLRSLPVTGPCRRAQAFDQGHRYAYYLVLDERDRTEPAAAPQ